MPNHSLTHGQRKTPHVALFVGSVVGYGLAALLYYSGAGVVGAALLSMSVFGAVIAYVMQTLAFVRPAIAYFGLIGRKRLVLSPEEEFAMKIS
ncbi:hypothetical protein [Mesorhizobium sp. 2RAF21]|uniref:hypothetical protein n=1 Tax=Mesorhizobium sp. 2RAF21 TaxID=3232995 RepID=UPI003F9C0C41